MNLLITKDYEAMSRACAMELMGYLTDSVNKRVNVAITAGSTPTRMYEIMQEFLKDLQYPNVHYYNFDEIPVKGEQGVTIRSLNTAFYLPNHINQDQIELFHEENYLTFDQKIKADGGLDMIMIGLGTDGHFCGNLSGTMTSYDQGCRAVSNRLNETLEKRMAFLSGGEDKMCEAYVTFGPKTVMQAKKIIMIVNGEHKAEILKRIINDPISLDLPSSILRLHPNITIIADEQAAKYVK